MLILLAVDSTVPEYFLRAFPENFIFTFWPFFTYGANVSGISTSTNRTEVSSKFSIIELFDTSISLEKFRLPIIPSKGVVMFLFFNFAITSPVLTFVLNLIGSKISYFSILKDLICAGTAVPNVSIVFWNNFC